MTVFQCPLDNPPGRQSYFQKEGSSYEWNYAFNNQPIDAPQIWIFSLPPAKVFLLYDYENFHVGGTNGQEKRPLRRRPRAEAVRLHEFQGYISYKFIGERELCL